MFPLHDPSLERDACGVGFVADLSARPRRDVVAHGLTALARLAHRGGSAVLGTIDGCGLLTAIPWRLLAREGAAPRGRRGALGLGMFFMPPGSAGLRHDIAHRLRACDVIVESWRRVPVDDAVLTGGVRSGAPDIWQAIVSAPAGVDMEAALYTARLAIERAAAVDGVDDFAIVSLSSTTVVYKALVEPADLVRFYPDLAAPEFESPFALFHQRFSTNTSADWSLAQPFRLSAHNGEINTIAGNRLWMRARLADRASVPPIHGDPIDPAGSDSRTLDTALDFLRTHGFTVPHALSRLLPPAWERDRTMPDEVRAFYEYQALVSESWEGPAAVVFCDGRHVGAALDRNGFRPARFVRTADGLLAVASEVGILDVPQDAIVDRGRLGPGEMLAFDLARQSVIAGAELRRTLARTQPYRRLVSAAVVRPVVAASAPEPAGQDAVRRLQVAFGYTREEIDVILRPMTTDAHEATGSMGDDAPLAGLSGHDRLLTDYFRQKFAQVTNPPIDPYREASVMSLVVRLGAHGSFVDETAGRPPRIVLNSPVLSQPQFETLKHAQRLKPLLLATTFPIAAGPSGLESALDELAASACDAVRDGASLVLLSDRPVSAEWAAIPALLATSVVHHALVTAGLRLRASIVVETGDVRDAHGLAALIAYGAAAVCPSLAYETIRTLEGASRVSTPSARYQLALQRGFVRILSKMGVCTATAYCGAQLFDTIGLDRAFVARYFPGTSAPLGGIGLAEIAEAVLARHARAFGEAAAPLDYPGLHGYRRNGEYHANNPIVIRQLHQARTGSDAAYSAFAALVHDRPPTSLRDLLAFRPAEPVSIDEVEPVDAICRRFFASAMSVGALAPEAHRTIAVAMNRLGARSNSGEGGEEPERYIAPAGGDWSGTRTKQIASARFGVTPAYLRSGDEIQIKIAQGSKPGEGGQLPGEKVVLHIARLRHAKPGTPLISPPVHHDIYSIEDLAQLIFDLKALHPKARLNVKLVSGSGVGIIAAGVAKAGAHAIQISGHDGGTGASPRSSIKHAGLPWELGLAEAHQVLVKNGLRDHVVLQTDGGLKTGRDIAVAAALGAEEYGFGTAALVAIGCVMARQCHLNTCPVGIATQRADLRARFDGTPEMLVGYLRLVAGELRGILAALGLRTVDALVGRVDLLEQRTVSGRAGRMDLAPMLVAAGWTRKAATQPARTATRASHLTSEKVATICNEDRAVGAAAAGAIAARAGDRGMAERSVRMAFTGSAGQSFGAFSLPGMELVLTGDANDYVGKGMHGGEIVVRPDARERGRTNQVLIGNTALYGATGGRLFVAGHAGERFAVRNSGATAVVEGVGDHACEYMTGGTVVILGPIGRNFAAGMSGGVAYVLAPDARLATRCNPDMVSIEPVDATDRQVIRTLVTAHRNATGSRVARRLLRSGDAALGAFRKIVPASAPEAAQEPEAEAAAI